MKKINLLVIALLFTMTATADHTKSTMTAAEKSILQEVCELRKNFITCLEDSANIDQLISCDDSPAQFPDEYSEIDTNLIPDEYMEKQSDLIFSYRIVLDDQHDHIWSAPFKVDFASCVENEMNKVSKDDVLSNLMNAIYPATKTCTLLIFKEMDRIQDCK